MTKQTLLTENEVSTFQNMGFEVRSEKIIKERQTLTNLSALATESEITPSMFGEKSGSEFTIYSIYSRGTAIHLEIEENELIDLIKRIVAEIGDL